MRRCWRTARRWLTPLEQLVESLLWEGYALYPYTPGGDQERDADAVRDRLPAAPTPPAWPSTFDHLELRCVLRCDGGARRVAAEVRFLAPPGERPPGAEQRLALPPATVVAVAARGWSARPTVAGALTVALATVGRARSRTAELEIVLRVENRTPCADGSRPGRRARPARCSRPTRCCASTAAASSRRSTGRAASVNTFPVLARRRRRRGGRRGDRAARPPADRAREPGRAVRLDRDRGGAAAARRRR